ncbi:MAG TPA: AlpA family phage regulatory protein [Dehalococcoidia bacterium]|nr:AlpA family phage regulatory protein [Dehalococcoidia bacterium]
MVVMIKGKKYYRTAEVCQKAGISRSTFFRWLRQGTFQDVANFDRRGWRLFNEYDLKRLKAEASQIKPDKKDEVPEMAFKK